MVRRYGSDVVAGALAYAMRYGAYSADSVIRIIHGKALKQKGRALLKNVPENIKDWLRSCAVEDHDLGFYDKFIKGTETNDKYAPARIASRSL
jgi:hypothetical protein